MSLSATQLGLLSFIGPFNYFCSPMIPKINSAFQRLPLDILATNTQVTQFKNATTHLINAVTFANANEMAMLVDRAIDNGAKINYFES